MAKNVIRPNRIVTAGVMASTVTSPATNIQFQDNVCYQCNYSGSPVGSFDVQTSADYNPNGDDPAIPINNTGTWAPLGLNIASAGGSPQVIDLNQLSMPWVRLVYTPVSGSGSLDVFVSTKTV